MDVSISKVDTSDGLRAKHAVLKISSTRPFFMEYKLTNINLDLSQQHRCPHGGVTAEALPQAAARASYSFWPLPGVSGLRSEAAEWACAGNCSSRCKEGGQSACSDAAGKMSSLPALILTFLLSSSKSLWELRNLLRELPVANFNLLDFICQ